MSGLHRCSERVDYRPSERGNKDAPSSASAIRNTRPVLVGTIDSVAAKQVSNSAVETGKFQIPPVSRPGREIQFVGDAQVRNFDCWPHHRRCRRQKESNGQPSSHAFSLIDWARQQFSHRLELIS
jgi:hypothetical protein